MTVKNTECEKCGMTVEKEKLQGCIFANVEGVWLCAYCAERAMERLREKNRRFILNE